MGRNANVQYDPRPRRLVYLPSACMGCTDSGILCGKWGSRLLPKKRSNMSPSCSKNTAPMYGLSGRQKIFLPEGFTHPGSPNGEFTKEMDIMDVWFDSGSSHARCLKTREDLQFPADIYIEGSDQYRGWFNSSLIISVAVNGCAPYKGVVSNGFTVDAEGKKMSKSVGNVIVPEQITEQFGADILRLWVASVDYTQDVRVFMENFKQVAEVYRKIRNTIRFMLGNISDFDPKTDAVTYEDLREIDQFMLVRLNDLLKKVREVLLEL